MNHLSRSDLLDLLDEPAAAATHRLHLKSCEACRGMVASLRATLADVRREDAPEPSPLFWDHFTARVAEAIREESPAARNHSRLGWFGGPAAGWTSAALLILLGMTTVISRVTLHAPTPVVRTGVVGMSESPELDQNWVEVREAARNLSWDATQAADAIGADPGTAEQVVMELNAEERAELARLIDGEIKRSGA
jgi:hypothetical protein